MVTVSTVVAGQLVRVHLNLTRGDFVICEPKSPNRLIQYVHDVTLRDVTFKVSEAQRQWCIRKKMRQVHAWATGTVVSIDTHPDVKGLQEITYNPFRSGSFTTRAPGKPVTRASEVTFTDRKGWAQKGAIT